MTHPFSSMSVVPAVHSCPRSVPIRSQQAMKTRLTRAAAMAICTSGGRSPAGRSTSGQLVGTAMSSAPASASMRVSSGNSRS